MELGFRIPIVSGIPGSKYWIPVCQWNLDSKFWIPIFKRKNPNAGIQISFHAGGGGGGGRISIVESKQLDNCLSHNNSRFILLVNIPHLLLLSCFKSSILKWVSHLDVFLFFRVG